MQDNTFDRATIEEMARDLRHRAKLEREIHNDYHSSKYLDNVAAVVSTVIELQDENEFLTLENRRLRKSIAQLREDILSDDF